jgi:hypothetical protein
MQVFNTKLFCVGAPLSKIFGEEGGVPWSRLLNVFWFALKL